MALQRLLSFTRLYLWLGWVVLAIDIGFKAGKVRMKASSALAVASWSNSGLVLVSVHSRQVTTAGAELAGGFVQAQNFLLSVHYVEIWNIVYCVVCLVPMLYSLAELGGRMRAVRKRKLRWYDSLRRLICTARHIALHDTHLCATSRCCVTGPPVAVMSVVSMHALFQKSSPCGAASVIGQWPVWQPRTETQCCLTGTDD